jgi:hypothetical protein
MPTDGRCPDDHDLLPLATGETATTAVTAHVAACPSCHDRVQRLRQELANLRGSLGDTAPVDPAVTALPTTVRAAPAGWAAGPGPRQRRRFWPLALGAVLAVTGGLVAAFLTGPDWPTAAEPRVLIKQGEGAGALAEGARVRVGDRLRCTFAIPHGYRPGLFRIEGAGPVMEETDLRVYPGGDGDQMDYPAVGMAALGGPGGTTALVVVANRFGTPTLAAVQQALGESPLPDLPAGLRALLLPDTLTFQGGNPDPAGQARMGTIRDRLAGKFGYVTGIAFRVEAP